MHETLDETLSALDDLIDEIDDWMIEHGYFYFDLDLNDELAARLDDLKDRLVGGGDTAVEPLNGYLHNTETHTYIIAIDTLREIGTPAAILQLVDALESMDSELCGYVSEALKKIGTSAIQPLIEKITYRLDNPAVDENGYAIDVAYTLGTLSAIRDPRSFDFMVGLLDRFADEGRFRDLAFLCSCLYDQHNPEIIPRLRAIVEKCGNMDTSNNVVTDANSTIRRLEVDQILESEDWMIYGCCCICKDYDKQGRTCLVSGDYEPRDNFCLRCRPKLEFCCDLCTIAHIIAPTDDSYKGGCSIDDIPPIFADLKYRLDQEEFTKEFEIATGYRDKGSIDILNDGMELSLEFHTAGDLNVMKEFFEGAGDYLVGAVRFFVDTEEIFDESYPEAVDGAGILIRGDDGCIVAVHKEERFELELVLDPDNLENLIAIIDTQRFLLLCDTHTYIDEFRERQDELESGLRPVRGRDEPAEEPEDQEETEEPGAPPPPCDHEFELLKTHKKYTVYRCAKCGGITKEFN
jgi:hypothetical protein